MSELNLYQRINEVRKKIDYIQKDKTVSTGTGGGGYKAVSHDQVTALVREHMIAQGIISYPIFVEGSMNLLVDVNGVPAKQSRYEAVYDFAFVNADKPEESICLRVQAHGMDSQDKAPGKALSYAKKYAILKLFEIETGEDEESRYQSDGMSDDRIDLWIFKINAADGEPKKQAYKDALAECVRVGDVEAANRIKDGVTPKAEVKNAAKS